MAEARENREQERIEQDKRIESVLSQIRTKLLVMSGKGGVGKSTVAVNLAAALAARGISVGLMDVDLHGPDTLKMLGLEGMPVATDGKRLIPIEHSPKLKVISISSFLKDADTAVIWRGPMKIGVIKQFIADVVWDALDYLIIDSPPGTGDEPLTVAQVVPGCEALIVTTPQDLSLLDVRKSITFCRQVSMPILGIIENMSGLDCPHCGKRIELFGSGGGEHCAEQMGVTFLGALPIDPSVVAAGDQGTPYVISQRDSPCKRDFSKIVVRVLEADEHRRTKTELNKDGT
jgi:ATP-binding protein involved in chromosome partitioning